MCWLEMGWARRQGCFFFWGWKWYCNWMFPKIGGFPPKSSILIGFSIINHPFLGDPYFWKHPIRWEIYHSVNWCRIVSIDIDILCNSDFNCILQKNKSFTHCTNANTEKHNGAYIFVQSANRAFSTLSLSLSLSCFIFFIQRDHGMATKHLQLSFLLLGSRPRISTVKQRWSHCVCHVILSSWGRNKKNPMMTLKRFPMCPSGGESWQRTISQWTVLQTPNLLHVLWGLFLAHLAKSRFKATESKQHLLAQLFHMYTSSGQISIIPKPEFSGDLGGFPLANHNLRWPRRVGRYNLPLASCCFGSLSFVGWKHFPNIPAISIQQRAPYHSEGPQVSSAADQELGQVKVTEVFYPLWFSNPNMVKNTPKSICRLEYCSWKKNRCPTWKEIWKLWDTQKDLKPFFDSTIN